MGILASCAVSSIELTADETTSPVIYMQDYMTCSIRNQEAGTITFTIYEISEGGDTPYPWFSSDDTEQTGITVEGNSSKALHLSVSSLAAFCLKLTSGTASVKVTRKR